MISGGEKRMKKKLGYKRINENEILIKVKGYDCRLPVSLNFWTLTFALPYPGDAEIIRTLPEFKKDFKSRIKEKEAKKGKKLDDTELYILADAVTIDMFKEELKNE
jgi:hypothetical protein